MAQSEILFSANNMNQLFVLQYSSGQYGKFDSLFSELEDYLLLLIADNPEAFNTLAGTRALIKQADEKILELIGSQTAEFIAEYPEFAEQQSSFAAMSLERAAINYASLTPAIGILMKDVFRTPLVLNGQAFELDDYINGKNGIADKTRENVNRALFTGYAEGRTTQQIITSIKGSKTVKGAAIPKSKVNAERVVRTALNHVATTSRQRTYKENKNLVVGYQWLSTLDSRTSPICRDRDLTVYYYADNFNPLPPAHDYCRSTTTPELNDNNPLKQKKGDGTRASKGAKGGKQVKDDLGGYNWLSNEPAWFQDEALGKTKGLIFRNAGLTPEEYKKASVNQFGQPLTIKQMIEKNKKIADYMSQ